MNKKDIGKLIASHNIKTADLIKYSTITLGALLFILGMILTFTGNIKTGLPIIFSGIIISIIPLTIIEFLKFSKISRLEEEFPKFLRDFSEAKKSGMTFPEALASRANTNYGELNKHLIKAKNQLSWGVPFEKVLNNLSISMKDSRLLSRSFKIIIEAFNAGGNVTEIMDDLSNDIRILKEVDQDRKNALKEQVWMMYIITIIFLVILTMLHKLLIPMISGGGMMDAFGGNAEPPHYCTGSAGFICSICKVFGWGFTSCDRTEAIKLLNKEVTRGKLSEEEAASRIGLLEKEGKDCITSDSSSTNENLSNSCYFKALFMYMAMIQGIFSGIIAGEIGDDSLASGAKHAIIIITIVIVVFVIL